MPSVTTTTASQNQATSRSARTQQPEVGRSATRRSARSQSAAGDRIVRQAGQLQETADNPITVGAGNGQFRHAGGEPFDATVVSDGAIANGQPVNIQAGEVFSFARDTLNNFCGQITAIQTSLNRLFKLVRVMTPVIATKELESAQDIGYTLFRTDAPYVVQSITCETLDDTTGEVTGNFAGVSLNYAVGDRVPKDTWLIFTLSGTNGERIVTQVNLRVQAS